MPKYYRLIVDIDRIQTMSLGDALGLLQLIDAEMGLVEMAREADPSGGFSYNQIVSQLELMRGMAEKRIAELKPLFYKIVDEAGRNYLSES